MPYIATDSRTDYDVIVENFFTDLTPENWRDRVAALIFSVSFDLYGDANNTRYFKQNEIVGVFAAAALEAKRRLGGAEFSPEKIHYDWKSSVTSVVKTAEKVVALVPRSDETQRCGHLNYFATELTLAAANRGWLKSPNGPGQFLLSLADQWYALVTGPYEDEAIAKNGDTPGYTKLLGT